LGQEREIRSKEQRPKKGVDNDTSLEFDEADRKAGLKLGDTLHLWSFDIQPTALILRQIRPHHMDIH
jgi:hypothetical protein